jgi:hypothetical protein
MGTGIAVKAASAFSQHAGSERFRKRFIGRPNVWDGLLIKNETQEHKQMRNAK